MVATGWRSDADRASALFLALQAGLSHNLFGNIAIFLPNGDIPAWVFILRKHCYLPFSSSITAALTNFLSHDQAQSVDFYRFKKTWSHLPGYGALENLYTQAQDHPLQVAHIPPPTTCKLQALASLIESYHKELITHPTSTHISCSTPLTLSPTPFTRGTLESQSRLLYCTGVCLTTGHAFHATYSMKFRPNAGDKVYCHCSTPFNYHLYTLKHIIFVTATKCAVTSRLDG